MVEVEHLNINGVSIEIVASPTAVVERYTEILVGNVALKPNLHVITSTGKSFEPIYQSLGDYAEEHPRAFSELTHWNQDIYVEPDERGRLQPLSIDDERGYQNYMARLAGRMGVKENRFPGVGNIHLPGLYDRLQKIIARQIDFAGVGIGLDHGFGFNFDGREVTPDSVTRHVVISPLTRQVNGNLYDTEPSHMPNDAITVGVGTALAAKKFVAVAFGTNKQAPVQKLVEEPASPENVAGYMKLHPDNLLLIDYEAAKPLL